MDVIGTIFENGRKMSLVLSDHFLKTGGKCLVVYFMPEDSILGGFYVLRNMSGRIKKEIGRNICLGYFVLEDIFQVENGVSIIWRKISLEEIVIEDYCPGGFCSRRKKF